MQKILQKLKITKKILLKHSKPFTEQIDNWNLFEKINQILRILTSLQHIGLLICKRLAMAEIDINILQNSYETIVLIESLN